MRENTFSSKGRETESHGARQPEHIVHNFHRQCLCYFRIRYIFLELFFSWCSAIFPCTVLFTPHFYFRCSFLLHNTHTHKHFFFVVGDRLVGSVFHLWYPMLVIDIKFFSILFASFRIACFGISYLCFSRGGEKVWSVFCTVATQVDRIRQMQQILL